MTTTAFSDASSVLGEHPELTMITAVERSYGIGRNNDLPWNLQREYAYFTRVTTRVPTGSPNIMNAVIMGRKNWDSIPVTIRPLPGRINIVISRSPEALRNLIRKGGDLERVHVVANLEEGVELLVKLYGSPISKDHVRLGRIFVIGGTDIYAIAFGNQWTVRLLLTKIYADFECDTFFPSWLIGDASLGEWRRQSKREFDKWVGEHVPQIVHENGVEYEFMMFERRSCLSKTTS
jgi:dihydrofolate reductase